MVWDRLVSIRTRNTLTDRSQGMEKWNGAMDRESFIVIIFTKVNRGWVGGLGPGVGNFGKRWWVGGSRRAGKRW